MVSSPFNLTNLNGANGFIVNGIAAGDRLGISLSGAGDLNGDGMDDLLLGANQADLNGASDAGQSYVVFGQRNGFFPSFIPSALNGSNGFILNGAASNQTGRSVSRAGDINGDGLSDSILGAPLATANGNSQAGQSYVVFGNQSGFPTTLTLSTLNGSNGFILNGIASDDRFGTMVTSIGDINSDGIEDILVGAPLADANGLSNAGQSYVVFGSRSGFPAALNLSTLDGSNGFVINGHTALAQVGTAVRGAGDVNGDGIDDLILGSPNADANGLSAAGRSYVVFGSRQPFPASLSLAILNGTDGFVINGSSAGERSGTAVSGIGDINGDGLDDVLIGAPFAAPAGLTEAGRGYILFGRASGFSASVNLATLTGGSGVVINGAAAGDRLGYAVNTAGDINGDGVEDSILGAPGADVNGNDNAGQSYVLFGDRTGFAATIDLATLSQAGGLVLNGNAAEDASGYVVGSAGDVNGDRIDDLVIGAPEADPNGNASAGQGYVVFGEGVSIVGLILTAPTLDASAVLLGSLTVGLSAEQLTINSSPRPIRRRVVGVVNVIGTTLDDAITGNAADNTLVGNAGNDTLNGNAGNDTLNGGSGADTLRGGIGDDIYVVDTAADVVSEANGSGIDVVQASITYSLRTDLENLVLTGMAAIDGIGNEADNRITGNAAENVLRGNGGNDTLIGGDGNDTLDGGAGTDALSGGLGDDLYLLDSSTDTVTEGNQAGNDTVHIAATYTLTAQVENLVLQGNTAINGTGNALANRLTGNSNDNELSGNAGDDTLEGDAGDDTLTGGNGNDSLMGDTGNDTLEGGAGNDILMGNAGNDTLEGGAGSDAMTGSNGNDLYQVDSDSDQVIEQEDGGTDTVQASISYTLIRDVENLTLTGAIAINGSGNPHANRITGNTADNILSGDAGNDTLTGNAGNDTLIGGEGADTLIGGQGNDWYVLDGSSDPSADSLTEGNGAGIDTVQVNQSYTLARNLENLTLTGTAAITGTGNEAANQLTGNEAANTLIGDSGNDQLIGGGGRDRLLGGKGSDRLTGNSGRDRFVFDIGTPFNARTIGTDVITDFQRRQDKLILDRTTFRTLPRRGIALAIVRNRRQAQDSNAQLTYIRRTGSLFYNSNGSARGFGTGGQFADLPNGLNLRIQDILTVK